MSEPQAFTGHERIDDALRLLDGLAEADLARHREVFDSVHDTLREALANAGDDANPAGGA